MDPDAILGPFEAAGLLDESIGEGCRRAMRLTAEGARSAGQMAMSDDPDGPLDTPPPHRSRHRGHGIQGRRLDHPPRSLPESA